MNTCLSYSTSVRKSAGNSYLGGALVLIQLLRQLLMRILGDLLGADVPRSLLADAYGTRSWRGLAIWLLGRPLERIVAVDDETSWKAGD